MRFLPSSPWRAAVRVVLTVAVLGVVARDLYGRSVKPEASGSSVLSFGAKESASSPRLAVTATGTALPQVCDSITAPVSNPYAIGNGVAAFYLPIILGGTCPPAPRIVDGTGTLAALSVASLSGLSFQNVQYTNDVPAAAVSGPLTMASGSFIETIISPTLVPSPTQTVVYPLLMAVGTSLQTCPSFIGVAFQAPINCPVDTSLAMLGAYTCNVTAATGYLAPNALCNISLVISGPLQLSSGLITMQFCRDCSLTFTASMFALAIYYTTGVGAAAIAVESWLGACPYTVAFRVRGSTPDLINAVVARIIYSARSGALGTFLGVNYAGLGYLPPYLARPTCKPATTPIFGPGSHSNPDLLILLVLLAIPVLLVVGAFAYLYCASLPKPAPAPVCPGLAATPLMGGAVMPSVL